MSNRLQHLDGQRFTSKVAAAAVATLVLATVAIPFVGGPTVSADEGDRSATDEILAPAANEACFYVFLSLLIASSGSNGVKAPAEVLPLMSPALDTCSTIPAGTERRICGADSSWLDYANFYSPNPMETAPVGIAVDTVAGAERASGDDSTKRAKSLDNILSCKDRRAAQGYEEFEGDGVVPLPTEQGPDTSATSEGTSAPASGVLSSDYLPRTGGSFASASDGFDDAPAVDGESAAAPIVRPTAADLVSSAEPVLAGSFNPLDLLLAALVAAAALYGLNRKVFGSALATATVTDADAD